MKNVKISLILNCIIVVLIIFASVIMFTGFKFMHGPDVILEEANIGMLRFFTVDSNLFMGIIALIFAYFDYILLKKEIKKIPKIIYLLKFMATAGVTLTFVIVFTYLNFIIDGGIKILLMNSNLFLHFITPVLSIITFVFFEKNKEINFHDSFYGLLPMFVYAIFYLGNVLIHMNHGQVSPKYDFYHFVQNGVWTMIIVIPIMTIVMYGISFVLWKLNKEK